MKLRKVIFWCHLTAGVAAGAIILVMSATGVALMYAPQIIALVERDMREVTPPADAQRLSLDALIAKTREHSPDFRPTGIMMRAEPTATVSVGFGREGSLFVNPYSGEVLGQGSKVREWFHAMEDWHRWLGQQGDRRATMRSITGAANLAFFLLAVTGVYLWWPRRWKRQGLRASLFFNRRLRGKARNWNWHNVIGFWSSSVLVILTLTAAVMSYPWANDLLYTLTGGQPPSRSQSSPSPRARLRGVNNSQERVARKPDADFELFFARAQQQVPGWIAMFMRFPPRGDGPVTVSIQEPGAPHSFARSQLTLNRATADVVKWEPYSEYSAGRQLRTWVRALHTGEAFGAAGQTIAGAASLGGCFLVWTGLAMAWRRLRSRHRRRIARALTSTATATNQVTSRGGIPVTTSTLDHSLQYDSANGTFDPEIEPLRRARSSHVFESLWQQKETGAKLRLLILFGTMTGNSESIAGQTALAAAGAGFDVQVQDMARCEPKILTSQSHVLIVTSTQGNGEPPETAMSFWRGVMHGPALNLHGVKFSVLALGNSTYDYFCQCGRDFDAALERHGATRFFPRIDCDADYDEAAKYWIEGVMEILAAHDRVPVKSLIEGTFSQLETIS